MTLTLTADDVTTNGRITVAYDAAKLTLTDKSGKAQYNSFSEKDGLVTFGYAYKESAPAGTVLATLTFAAAEDTRGYLHGYHCGRWRQSPWHGGEHHHDGSRA